MKHKGQKQWNVRVKPFVQSGLREQFRSQTSEKVKTSHFVCHHKQVKTAIEAACLDIIFSTNFDFTLVLRHFSLVKSVKVLSNFSFFIIFVVYCYHGYTNHSQHSHSCFIVDFAVEINTAANWSHREQPNG